MKHQNRLIKVSYILPPQSFSSELSPTPQSILPSHLKVLGMHLPLSQVNSCSAQVYALKNNNINTIYESFNKVKFLQIKKKKPCLNTVLLFMYQN